MITFRQTNSANRTSVHDVSQMVISPLQAGDLLQEIRQSGSMSEFLFEMTKDGHVYWIGAAVPSGTSDFSKVQVFFHPTVKQQKHYHAKDTDYPTFTGGWSGTMQRYVAMQGGQLAGARKTALIVPFMTMKAAIGRAPDYMFATKSIETLNAIMTAVRAAATPGGVPAGNRRRPSVESSRFKFFIRNRLHAAVHRHLRWDTSDCGNDGFRQPMDHF